MNYLDEEPLPDFELPETECEQSIDEIIAEDNAAKKNEEAFFKKGDVKKKSKTALFGVLGGVVAVGTIAGIVLFNPFGGNQKDANPEPKVVATTVAPTDKATDGGDKPPTQAQIDNEQFFIENPFPIKLDKWQKEAFDLESGKGISKIKESVLKTSKGSNLSTSSKTLPSEAQGFTSKKTDKFNPLYAYWTKEVFESEVTTMTERLINPVFGRWTLMQESDMKPNENFYISLFEDLMTDDYYRDNFEKPYSEWVPVYADWNHNDYGMPDSLVWNGMPKWFGKVTSSVTEFSKDSKTGAQSAKYTAKVKFTAWDVKTQGKITKKGTLVLDLVPNDKELNSSNNRVLINGASLEVE